MDELASLAKLAANTEVQKEQFETLNYAGQGDAAQNGSEEEPLKVPTMNFGEKKD